MRGGGEGTRVFPLPLATSPRRRELLPFRPGLLSEQRAQVKWLVRPHPPTLLYQRPSCTPGTGKEGQRGHPAPAHARARWGRIFFIHSTKSLVTHQWARQGDTWRGALDAGGTPHALAARPPCSLNFLGARLRADRQSGIGRNNYSTDLWAQ